MAELGFSGVKKTLEPIVVAGEKVYGGRFPMLGRGPLRVDVEFRVPGAVGPERGTFYFTHPSFAPGRTHTGSSRHQLDALNGRENTQSEHHDAAA